MSKAISVQNLTKAYPLAEERDHKTLQALKGISFDVEQGEIFGILGPNGAGKTTALEIMESLKTQTSGKVEVLGFDNIKSGADIKKRIGAQLQFSDYLPYLTLNELLNLFSSLYNQPADSKKLLALVGLEDKQHEQVKNLSGGQKQRFTLATSLVNRPEILFLDEPTTGLDPQARRDLWRLIKTINANRITIVLTTHYMEEAEYLCHRVAVLDQGQLLEIDEPKKLMESLPHAIQVSFFSSDVFVEEAFKNSPEVLKIYSLYPKTILDISSIDHIQTVINLLKAKNINFSGFTVKTASLEDVYLKLTGREFAE